MRSVDSDERGLPVVDISPRRFNEDLEYLHVAAIDTNDCIMSWDDGNKGDGAAADPWAAPTGVDPFAAPSNDSVDPYAAPGNDSVDVNEYDYDRADNGNNDGDRFDGGGGGDDRTCFGCGQPGFVFPSFSSSKCPSY